MTKKVLLRDIVIPAGTVFDTAPSKTTRDDSHYDCVVGLSNNTSGVFTYGIDDDFPGELDQYFTDLK
jgi:hypothetical protein